MKTIKDLEAAVKEAMKASNALRLGYLRGLLNQVKLIAKNDGNREPTDDDLISAANRIVKQARETQSFLPEGDERRIALDAEIATVQEFLPKQMDNAALEATIEAIMRQQACPEGKAARGYIMKTLNADYRGAFDARSANEILSAKL